MSTILFYQPKRNPNKKETSRNNLNKTNPSRLPFYLGIKGARGKNTTDKAAFQGTPLLMYFDIFKNYFANTQEESFYVASGVGEDPLILKFPKN